MTENKLLKRADAMKQQLTRLESELAMLGPVIDFFKLYSVDDRL